MKKRAVPRKIAVHQGLRRLLTLRPNRRSRHMWATMARLHESLHGAQPSDRNSTWPDWAVRGCGGCQTPDDFCHGQTRSPAVGRSGDGLVITAAGASALVLGRGKEKASRPPASRSRQSVSISPLSVTSHVLWAAHNVYLR